MKNVTAARKVEEKDLDGRPRKQVVKLVVARDKADRKVTKLRLRLTRAENKLAKQMVKLDVADPTPAQAVHPIAEAALPTARPITAAASPNNVPYEHQHARPAAPANKRKNSRPKPKAATPSAPNSAPEESTPIHTGPAPVRR